VAGVQQVEGAASEPMRRPMARWLPAPGGQFAGLDEVGHLPYCPPLATARRTGDDVGLTWDDVERTWDDVDMTWT